MIGQVPEREHAGLSLRDAVATSPLPARNDDRRWRIARLLFPRIRTRLDHAVMSAREIRMRIGNAQSEEVGAKAVATSRSGGVEAQKGCHLRDLLLTVRNASA